LDEIDDDDDDDEAGGKNSEGGGGVFLVAQVPNYRIWLWL